jgi:hypothetical protein
MKSALVAAALLAGAIGIAQSVRSSDAPDRPPGVATNAWVPISDKVGFVISQPKDEPARLSPQVLLIAPPVAGYFMLKGASGWTRIVISEPIPGDAG